ncbi:hypothetical protein [Actinomadura terrae]|nr:hypothetical protein [Actinomadura terrae]
MSPSAPERPVQPKDVPAKIVASVPSEVVVEPADKLVYSGKAAT